MSNIEEHIARSGNSLGGYIFWIICTLFVIRVISHGSEIYYLMRDNHLSVLS